MSGIINRQELERIEGTVAYETPMYSDNPDRPVIMPPQVERKGIWTKDGDHPAEFLSAQSLGYCTVQNSTVVQAMDDIAYDKGISLEVNHASYYKGKTMVNFFLPGEDFKVPGDSSVIKPGILWTTDFGGGGANEWEPSSFRGACSNGQVFKTNLAKSVKRKHYGQITERDIYIMVAKAFDLLDTAVQVIKLTSSMAAMTEVSDDQIEAYLKRLEKKTAKKYHERMAAVVQDNVNQLGQNAWAVTQGISEMYTHHMKTPSHGGTKLAWRDKAIDDLLASVGVKELVHATITGR